MTGMMGVRVPLLPPCFINLNNKKMAKKQYLKTLYIHEFKFANGGVVLNLSCKLDKLVEELQALKNDAGYVNFHIAELREPKVFPNGKSTTHCSYVMLKDEDTPKEESLPKPPADPFSDF